MKKKYSQEFNKIKNKLSDIQKTATKLGSNEELTINKHGEPQNEAEVSENLSLKLIKEKINEKLLYMRNVSDTFPRPNGFVLINN